MTKLIFLGTSGAVASKSRDNTSILLLAQDQILLVDCPGSLVAKLDKLDIDFRKISKILFTHSHPDHIYGLVSLLHSQYRLKNTVEVFAHRRVIKFIKVLRKIFGLEDTSKYPKIIYNNLLPESQQPFFESRHLSISAFRIRHALDSLGFRFFLKHTKSTIVFSTDTAVCSNTAKIAKSANYLIHDCFSPSRFFKTHKQLNQMHTSSLDLGRLAKKTNVKTLIPIHFATEITYSIGEIRSEIRKNFKGKLIIPRDLDVLRLG